MKLKSTENVLCTPVYVSLSLLPVFIKTTHVKPSMLANHKQKRYSLEERYFIFSTFNSLGTTNNRANKCIFLFRRKYPYAKIPSTSTVYRICTKFEDQYTLANLHKGQSGRRRSVITDDNKMRAEVLLAEDRNLSFDQTASSARRNRLNITKSSWSRMMKEMNQHCFRYSVNQGGRVGGESFTRTEPNHVTVKVKNELSF